MTSSVRVDVDNETTRDIDLGRWAELVRSALEQEKVAGPAEVAIRFVDAETVTALNVEHLGGTGPTDVLSFPLDDDPHGDLGPTGVRFVGDIVLCPDVAEANAPDHAGTFDDEVAMLLIHSTLHLLGHDHQLDEQRAAMWSAERRLMGALWPPLTRDPWSSR